MIKYGCFILVIFLSFHFNAFSQSKDSILRVYNTEAIYRIGNKYMKGNERLTFRELAREFTTPHTQGLYHKSKRLLSVSRIFNVASFGLIITSILTRTNITGSIEFAAGTGALGLGGIYFQTESSKYSERAIWERNRDILSGTIQQ